MALTIKELQGDELLARDGPIGAVDDVYFDDERWGVRYLVVDTGNWLPGRRVLISPASLEAQTDAAGHALHARLTREQVERAPGVETDEPVSRRYEKAHATHYAYPHYWGGPMLWGAAGVPIPPVASQPQPVATKSHAEGARKAQEQAEAGDAHLRSGREVIGYQIEARDGALGSVDDFVVDERSWGIRDVVVDTKPWWPGGQVFVHPEYVERIDWGERKMYVRLTREELKNAGAQAPRR